jgi:hypothetical protein
MALPAYGTRVPASSAHLSHAIVLLSRCSVRHLWRRSQVDTARGRALADEYGMRFYETSAKDGTNVAEALNGLAHDIVAKMIALDVPDGASGGSGTTVKQLKDRKKDKDCVVQ